MKKLFTFFLLFTIIFLGSCKKGDNQRVRVLLKADTGTLEECNFQVLSTSGIISLKGKQYNASFKVPQNQLDLVKFNQSEEILATAENLSGGSLQELRITLGECSVMRDGKKVKLYLKDPAISIAIDKGLEKSLTDIKLSFSSERIIKETINSETKYYLDASGFELTN